MASLDSRSLRYVLTVITSLLPPALGCSSEEPRETRNVDGAEPDGDDEDDDDDDDEGPDAGSRGGDNASNTRDGGSKRDGATRPPAQAPNAPAGEPKELVTRDDCSKVGAGLNDGDIELLKKGGSAEGLSYLYPYDGTVFPRGLKAPLYMWKGGEAKGVYVRIRSKYFEYDGCLKPTAAGELELPADVWEAASKQTLGPATPFTVELTTLEGQKARGPIKQTIVIAQASLKGSIYYNSYDSKLATGGGAQPSAAPAGFPGFPGFGGGGNGAVIRIKPGEDAEFFTRQGSCTGCHSLSVNGKRLIAADVGGAAMGAFGGTGMNGNVFNLEEDTPSNPEPARSAANAAFVGMYPDGSLYLSSAATAAAAPNIGAFGTVFGMNTNAILYETDTGMVVENSGVPPIAGMPTFSPDGKLLVFSDLTTGKSIAVMKFDGRARKASDLKKVYESSKFTGWPFLLPDNGGVVFTVGDPNNFTGGGAYIGAKKVPGAPTDLYMADVNSGKGVILAKAMGFATPEDAAQNKTYLPFGEEELHQNYYPTVSPTAAGGYFWIFFDSIRRYGNKGLHRALWGAAVRVSSANEGAGTRYDVDLSQPAFYLPGQELEAGNHRAFTALDPCREDGQDCESGIDCCSGFCTDGVCGPPVKECSETNESCESDDDCCRETDRCLGGYCGEIILL